MKPPFSYTKNNSIHNEPRAKALSQAADIIRNKVGYNPI